MIWNQRSSDLFFSFPSRDLNQHVVRAPVYGKANSYLGNNHNAEWDPIAMPYQSLAQQPRLCKRES